ncbi:MAG TPA: hypothetical protein VMF61_01430 [Candidatus Acidoferrales bacterium]|nr:hypothetical protein [Candidatus Acidoferrales bacterium]
MSRLEIDPTQATSWNLGRRAFVGLSAAAASIGSTAEAMARPAPGRLHPAIVPADAAAVAIERVRLQRPGGATGASSASVVVVAHAWGVDRSTRDVVRGLATAGLAAIARDAWERTTAFLRSYVGKTA